MAAPLSTVILSDGDLPALVALAHAAEARLGGGGGVLASGVHLWPAEGSAERRRVLSGQAARFGGVVETGGLSAGIGAGTGAGNGTDLLLSAGRWGAQAGVAVLVWPAWAGVEGEPEGLDLRAASRICEAALLVERLLATESPRPVTIETPLADLSDRQVADLAVDLGLMTGPVWWGSGGGAEAESARLRWSRAFEACGAPLPARSAEAKPAPGAVMRRR
jgi:hypothetical protein